VGITQRNQKRKEKKKIEHELNCSCVRPSLSGQALLLFLQLDQKKKKGAMNNLSSSWHSTLVSALRVGADGHEVPKFFMAPFWLNLNSIFFTTKI
jgi:hypothetical protein